MKRNAKSGVFSAIRAAAASHKWLSAGTLLCAAASVLASLLPPLLLGRIIDRLTGGAPVLFPAALLYFGSLALEGVLSSAQETLLEIFGQKMTHALRSEMSAKLTRLHNDSNVLALGARVTGMELARAIAETWLTTPFSGEERHRRRIALLTDIENGKEL